MSPASERNNLPPPDPESPEVASVGSAQMLADGTLHLHLRAVDRHGTIGEMLDVVRPDDARYAEVLAHLGGLQPGGSCAIPPFPGVPFVDDDEDDEAPPEEVE